jgi:hypothetical protein
MATVSDPHIPTVGVRPRLGGRLLNEWKTRGPLVVPPRAEWSRGLRSFRLAGLGLIGLEFIGFCIWSAIEVHRFALTADFSLYQQAVYLLAHGHLWPHVTDGGAPISFRGGHLHAFPLFSNEAEFFLVPIAILYWIWPHVLVAKLAQDAAICGGQVLAFLWMCEVVAANRARPTGDRFQLSPRTVMWVLAFGLVLLLANPWFMAASSFDFHAESFALPCIVGAARALHKGRRRAALAWALGGILSSAVGTTYVVGVGLSAAFSRRSALRDGLIVAGMGLVWFVFLSVAGLIATAGPGLFVTVLNAGNGHLVWENGYWKTVGATAQNATYGQLLKTIATHPWNIFVALWRTHSSLWANIAAPGVLGLVWPPVLIATLAVLGQSAFAPLFIIPGSQNVVVYGLIAVGSVAVVIWILGRRRRVGYALMALLAVNTIVWGAMWFPRLSHEWAPVSAPAVAALRSVQKMIGPNDEVVASQGVSGVFADRQSSYTLTADEKAIDLRAGRRVWFVIAPFDGIETDDVSVSVAYIQRLSNMPGVHLRLARGSVWAFDWMPPVGLHKLLLKPANVLQAPSWTLPGPSGRAVERGASSSSWFVTNTGAPGYVFDRGLWRVPAGRYRVSVTLSAAALTNVEVWDTTKSELLKRVVVSNTHGRTRLTLPVVMAHTGHQPFIGGSLLWAVNPEVNLGDSLELRVWTAGRAGSVNVYAASISGTPSS